MAKVIHNEKGFKVIECAISETTKFGGAGICDSCNNADFVGFLICVLNSWYCKNCFVEWEKRATYYIEDQPTEKRNFEYYKNILGINNDKIIIDSYGEYWEQLTPQQKTKALNNFGWLHYNDTINESGSLIDCIEMQCLKQIDCYRPKVLEGIFAK